MDISKIRVALDGPSGAGKSTVAKILAEKMGYVYVDTGALYRTVGLYAMENGVAKDDERGIIALLESIDVRLTYENGEQHVLLCGCDVGGKIRTPEASMYASAVSKIPEVRAYLLDLQKKIAEKGGVVMDGRDIGTVIMPDAEIKVFMTATPEERARRRLKELIEKGENVTFDEVLADMIQRDKNDSERAAAPLKPADDAVMFINDGYDAEGSADYIIDLIRKKTNTQ
ncbi:MAG: (d)CMP kinase [Ruminococcaceae bacterium]|nr:(d)CMP kinase [Oscillospiraceae bacterium]